jgi:hypothetical protein
MQVEFARSKSTFCRIGSLMFKNDMSSDLVESMHPILSLALVVLVRLFQTTAASSELAPLEQHLLLALVALLLRSRIVRSAIVVRRWSAGSRRTTTTPRIDRSMVGIISNNSRSGISWGEDGGCGFLRGRKTRESVVPS